MEQVGTLLATDVALVREKKTLEKDDTGLVEQ